MTNNQNKGEICTDCIFQKFCKKHTIQTMEKLFIPQSTTLGTTMEERLDEKFPMLSGVKVTPDRDSDFEKAKILQQYWNNIEKNLKDFINKEISQSKAETIKECIEKIEIWLLRLHNEPELWTVDQALDSIKTNLLSKDIEQ